ncbi:succinate dehydrogenase assembly factor 2 [Candidatus Sororendozoicomonas aggregata]|uniref:FAD assembly factor SdhE n=1 Tax=Candidatus Sororendozoicomonas aggregata TaxID=3073239 RepID=UPI002ED08D69
MTSEDAFRRLQWHSRRGMLELDVLLLPFTNNCFKALPEEAQKVYTRLLACEDPDLFRWFMTSERPENPGLSAMVDTVLASSGKVDAV